MYILREMTQEQAEDIAKNWHYNDIYSFYDMDADEEDLVEFLDPKQRAESMFVVINAQDIIGYFSFNRVDKDTIDIGLGMNPNLTGSGKGVVFLNGGLEFAKYKYNPKRFTLSVATFNHRAIKVYKKVGFEEVDTFMQDTNGSSFEFLKMTYQC
jgi:ribosomal-protein-alanine N-acetyltransferase